MSLAEQELLTLPEHPSSLPVISEVRVAQCLAFCVLLCESLLVFLSFFFLAFVFSVIRFPDSHCPFDVFKLLVLQMNKWYIQL